MMPVRYQDFLRGISDDGGLRAVQVYHAVRNIPYGSPGERDPVAAIENNVGSCSAKHILLRDLLRTLSYDAELITIFTFFNKGVPLNDSYPDELAWMIREGQVSDFHHYLRCKVEDRWLDLDATWHDALAPYGFPVNTGWNGTGNTMLAAEPIRTYGDVRDVARLKEELIASLSAEERGRRTRFFSLLADWIASLPEGRSRT